jgi:capsular polysaccharide transport system permease protein
MQLKFVELFKTRKVFTPFYISVLLPFMLFAFYLALLASSRYESQAKIIIKEADGMATLEPSLAILSGYGASSGTQDAELVKAYVRSNDMFLYLDNSLHISEHFMNSELDIFSRLSENASSEEKLSYYLSRVLVEIDEKSSIVSIRVQGFDSQFTHELALAIVERAEVYINGINQNLAKAQLSFVQKEHELITEKLQKAKSRLLAFQHKYNLLDPEAEGQARQQIAYGLETEITSSKAELRSLLISMSEDAPLVIQIKEKLKGLIAQLDAERDILTKSESQLDKELGVGEILSRYTDYKINLDLALQAYTSSQLSLEKSRIQAYKQLKYLVVVQSPTIPEDALYPKIIYNLSLFFVISIMLYGICQIILATVKELS